MKGDQRRALKIWEKYNTELYDGDTRKCRIQPEDTRKKKEEEDPYISHGEVQKRYQAEDK
jgi:hypothetical protein